MNRMQTTFTEKDLPYQRQGRIVCPRCKEPVLIYRRGSSPSGDAFPFENRALPIGSTRVYRCVPCNVRYPRMRSGGFTPGMRRVMWGVAAAFLLSRLLGGL